VSFSPNIRATISGPGPTINRSGRFGQASPCADAAGTQPAINNKNIPIRITTSASTG
jgi:hypothetical protein